MKNKSLTKVLCIFSAFFAIIAIGCTSDETDEPTISVCETANISGLTFVADIQPIVQQKCTTGGCHGSGSFNGDFTSYLGMLPDLENGRVNEEVVIDQTMPLNGSEDLTDLERDMFECWLESGFPEN